MTGFKMNHTGFILLYLSGSIVYKIHIVYYKYNIIYINIIFITTTEAECAYHNCEEYHKIYDMAIFIKTYFNLYVVIVFCEQK